MDYKYLEDFSAGFFITLSVTSEVSWTYLDVDSKVEHFLQIIRVSQWSNTCTYKSELVPSILIKLRLWNTLKDLLKDTTDTEFEAYKKRLEKILSTVAERMGEFVSSYWDEISEQTYYFERGSTQNDELRFIVKNDVLTFFDVCIQRHPFILPNFSGCSDLWTCGCRTSSVQHFKNDVNWLLLCFQK